MTPEEKAKELVEKFIPSVYCYIGSGMLTNSYDENVAKSNAKACALICIQVIIDELEEVKQMVDDNLVYSINQRISHYESVKNEINKL